MLGTDANQLSRDNIAVPAQNINQMVADVQRAHPDDQTAQIQELRQKTDEYRREHALTDQEQRQYLQAMHDMGAKSVTVPIYWNQVEPQQGKFDYAKVDHMIDMAREFGMQVKLHPMVWANCYPSWVDKAGGAGQAEQANTEAMIKRHIDQVVQHFGNKVDYLETNEVNSSDQLRLAKTDQYGRKLGKNGTPITDDTQQTQTVPVHNGLTDWIQHDGAAAVINKVDAWTREDLLKYGSRAKLFENEYDVDQQTQSNDARVATDRNHPDALGVQMHMFNGNYPNVRETWPLLRMAKALNDRSSGNSPAYVSEVTVPTMAPNQGVDESRFSPEVLNAAKTAEAYRAAHNLPPLSTEQRQGQELQAEQLLALYKVAGSTPNVNGVSLWDFTDRNSWIHNTGGVLDEQLKPKISYYAIQTYLAERGSGTL